MRAVRKYVLLGLLFPGLAWGADVRLSIGGSVEYDDNITRSEDNRDDDVVFRVTPRVQLVEDREKLNYSVGYAVPYEVGVTSSEINDLNQLADASVRYRMTPQTEIFANDAFFYVRGLFSQQQNLTDPTLGDVGDDRARVLQNDVSVGVRHQFTPRLSGSLLVNNGVYDTNQFARANVLSFGTTASSEYQLTPHHQVGGGFSFSRQSFEDTFNRPQSETDYYNIFGSWQWLFDETTSFNIRVGPALINSNQDAAPATVSQQTIPFTQNDDGSVVVFANNPGGTCPTMEGKLMGVPTDYTVLRDNAGNTCPQILIPASNVAAVSYITSPGTNPVAPIPYVEAPESVASTRITYFASASLTKRWSPTLASSLAYTRQDNGASGIDGGAVLDALTLSNTWRISERWDAALRTDWTQRKSATDGARIFAIPGDAGVPGAPGVASAVQLVQIDSSDSLNTQRWGLAGRLAYRLTKNTVTAAQYAYNKQSSKGDTVGQESDFDNHLVTFTVQYNFEPIGLWW